jgi:hypothetical protein
VYQPSLPATILPRRRWPHRGRWHSVYSSERWPEYFAAVTRGDRLYRSQNIANANFWDCIESICFLASVKTADLIPSFCTTE